MLAGSRPVVLEAGSGLVFVLSDDDAPLDPRLQIFSSLGIQEAFLPPTSVSRQLRSPLTLTWRSPKSSDLIQW